MGKRAKYTSRGERPNCKNLAPSLSRSPAPHALGMVVRLGNQRIAVPHFSAMSAEERDRTIWGMKKLCFNLGIIPSLGGRG